MIAIVNGEKKELNLIDPKTGIDYSVVFLRSKAPEILENYNPDLNGYEMSEHDYTWWKRIFDKILNLYDDLERESEFDEWEFEVKLMKYLYFFNYHKIKVCGNIFDRFKYKPSSSNTSTVPNIPPIIFN